MADGKSFTGAGFSTVHRERQQQVTAMLNLNNNLRETMHDINELATSLAADGTITADMVTQLVKKMRDVADVVSSFTKLTTGQIVSNGQTVQRVTTMYDTRVRQLLDIADQLQAMQVNTADGERFADAVAKFVAMFRDNEQIVNHVANAVKQVQAAVPTSAELMNRFASSFGGNMYLNSGGEWAMRRRVSTPAEDAELEAMRNSLQNAAAETRQLVEDAASADVWTPPADVDELTQRVDAAARDVAQLAQRIVNGDVDPAMVARVDQVLRTVQRDTSTAGELGAPRDLKRRFDEVGLVATNALSAIVDIKVNRDSAVDATHVLLEQLNSFSTASLKALSTTVDGVVAGVVVLDAAKKKRRARVKKKQSNIGLQLNGLDKLVDTVMQLDGPRGAMVADSATRVIRQGKEAAPFLAKLKLGSGRPARVADIDAAALTLTKMASSHIDMNNVLNERVWLGNDKRVERTLDLAGQSSRKLAETMTELLTMAQEQGAETPALGRLREQRDQLLFTADKFGRVKRMLGEVQSAWAAARDGFFKAFKLLAGGLGFMGAGALANAIKSPFDIPRDVMASDVELGMIRYRTAMAQVNANMEINQGSINSLAGTSRRLFEQSYGRLGLDEAQQMYMAMLEAGGPRGGTAAQRDADAMYATEQLVYMKAVGGTSAGTLQNAMKVFYHDAGESVRTVTSRLYRLTSVAQANGVPVEQMINTVTGIAQAMREYGVTGAKVAGVIDALVTSRRMRIEDAAAMMEATSRATASFGDNWGRSAFSHVAMGRSGSIFSTIRRNMMTHDENLNPIDEHYDDVVDQMFNLMDVTAGAHGGYGSSTGLMMADKQLREMGYGDQQVRSTMLASLATGNRDALKKALQAADSGENELVPTTKDFADKLKAARDQLSAIDNLEAQYKMFTVDIAQHVESVFGSDLENIPTLVEKMLGSMVTLVDWALDKLGGAFSGDGLGARWLRRFAEDPGETGAYTLAAGGLSLGALKYGARYGLSRLAQGASRFVGNVPAGAVKGLSGRGAVGLAALALAALGYGAYSLYTDERLDVPDEPPTEPNTTSNLGFMDRLFGLPEGNMEEKQAARSAAAERRRAEWRRLLDSSKSAALLREDALIYEETMGVFINASRNLGISHETLIDVATKSFDNHKQDITKANAITKEAWANNFEYFLRVFGNIRTAAEAASRRTFIDKNKFVQQAMTKWANDANERGKWFEDLANKESDPRKKSLYSYIANFFYNTGKDTGHEDWQNQIQALTALARGEGTEEGDDARAQMWNTQWNAWIKAKGGRQHSADLGHATAEEVREMLAWVAVNEGKVQQQIYAEKKGEAAWRQAVAVPTADAGDLDIRTVRAYTAEAIYEAFQARAKLTWITRNDVAAIIAAAQSHGIDPVFFAAALIGEQGSRRNIGNVRSADGNFYDFSSFEEGVNESARVWQLEIHRAGTGNMWKVANIYDPNNPNYVPAAVSIMNEIYGAQVVNPGANPIRPGENSWVVADDDDTPAPPPGTLPSTYAGAGDSVLTGGNDLLEQGYLRWKDTGKAGIINGPEGCAEAVTKMGAEYSPWLAQQLETRNWSVENLAKKAREDNLLEEYDPSRPLRRGDVAIWMNYSAEDTKWYHANIADGSGGFYNNTSENYRESGRTHDFIEHVGSDYTAWDGIGYVIRTGSGVLTGGGYAPAGAVGGVPPSSSSKPQTLKDDMTQRWAVYNANTGGQVERGVLVDNMRLARPGEDVDLLSQQLLASEKALAEQHVRDITSATDEEKQQVNWKDVVRVVSDVVKEYGENFSIVINGEVQESV